MLFPGLATIGGAEVPETVKFVLVREIFIFFVVYAFLMLLYAR